MKNRPSPFNISSEENDTLWTLDAAAFAELAKAPGWVTRVQLGIKELSRQVASASRQIRALVAARLDVPAMPAARPPGRSQAGSQSPRAAFAAITTDKGAMVVQVWQDTVAVWPQKEYGYFETWTRAQVFAGMLNESSGISPAEARQIIVSAILASANSRSVHS